MTVSPMLNVSVHLETSDSLAFLNVIEIILNLEYLYLRHFSSRTTQAAPGTKVYHYHAHAPLVGFSAALMTLSKTALYFIQGGCGGRTHEIVDRSDRPKNTSVTGAWSDTTMRRLSLSSGCSRM